MPRMTDPIVQAIRFANDKEHAGAGYTLLLHLHGGTQMEVDVYQKEGLPYLLRRRSMGPSDGAEVFTNPESVAAATILW